jgi:hypothetical protein
MPVSNTYYLTDNVCNYNIQQRGSDFYFKRWLSSQNNYNLFPYAIDNTAEGNLFTRISNPSFVLDPNDFFDPDYTHYHFNWIYLKSTMIEPNHEKLFYKTNVTSRGLLSREAADPSYVFKQPNIHLAVKVGDFFYISFVNDNTDITSSQSIVCSRDAWHGSLFRVIDTSVADQITLIEDLSIFSTIFPSGNINNFVYPHPSSFPELIDNYAILYDLGYCFHRPSEQSVYNRPIAITIDDEFNYSFGTNGTLITLDNFSDGADTLFLGLFNKTCMMSLLMPICRKVSFKFYAEMSDLPTNIVIEGSPVCSPEQLFIDSMFNSGGFIKTYSVYTRELPIFRFSISSSGDKINKIGISVKSADYLYGRI